MKQSTKQQCIALFAEKIKKQISSKNTAEIIETENIIAEPIRSFSNEVFKITIKNPDSFCKQFELDYNSPLLKVKHYLLKQFRPVFTQFTNVNIQNYVVQNLAKINKYPTVLIATDKFRWQYFIEGQTPQIKQISQENFKILVTKLAQIPKYFQQAFKNNKQKQQIEALKPPKINSNSIQVLYEKFRQISEECKNNYPDDYLEIQQMVEDILSKKRYQAFYGIFEKVPLIPSHNDCHLSNVLISKQQLFLLDYQFFALSYQGYDLGNFFNECATDYITFQISEELQLSQQLKKEMIKHYYEIIGRKQVKLQEAEQQVFKGRILSHIFWFFIGVKQLRDPKIELDMKYYIKRRYEQSLRMLEKLA